MPLVKQPRLSLAAIQLCSAEEDEIMRAQRRRDEAALRSEWEVGGRGDDGAGADDATKMLRERIDLIETKEKDISEIKMMLRTV